MSSHTGNELVSTPQSSRLRHRQGWEFELEPSAFVTPSGRGESVPGMAEESPFSMAPRWNVQEDEELPFFEAGTSGLYVGLVCI